MNHDEYADLTTIAVELRDKRDQFAMAALTGLLASGRLHVNAQLAYEHADAMMIEREIKHKRDNCNCNSVTDVHHGDCSSNEPK